MAFRKGWSMEVKGLRELERAMRQELPAAVSRSKTLSAIRAAAKPMETAAKAHVPKQSGALAESIGLKTVPKGRRKTYASMTLSPISGRPDVFAKYMAYHNRDIKIPKIGQTNRIRHGHLVEFGFRHTSGKHVPARSFLRRAFDEQAEGFVTDFKRRLKTRIENAVRKKRGFR